MSENLLKSINICNQIIDLFEDDYQKLYQNLQGELYDEYKILMLEEIERVKTVKQAIAKIQ